MMNLMDNLADWMESHGTVFSDQQRSNQYVGVRIFEVSWHNTCYRIIQVDGETCRIEKM